MKTVLIATALLGLSGAAASADEAYQALSDLRTDGVTTRTEPTRQYPVMAGASQNPFPFLAQRGTVIPGPHSVVADTGTPAIQSAGLPPAPKARSVAAASETVAPVQGWPVLARPVLAWRRSSTHG